MGTTPVAGYARITLSRPVAIPANGPIEVRNAMACVSSGT